MSLMVRTLSVERTVLLPKLTHLPSEQSCGSLSWHLFSHMSMGRILGCNICLPVNEREFIKKHAEKDFHGKVEDGSI